jgi:demethylmenaquinone methyltransferase/2-methoxy-6-polyprenyl-1,4-benzoquinol methylase
MLTVDELIDLYRRRAPRYNVSANMYKLMGFRENHYRRRAVDALGLRPGDTVVELGCGTGLNFDYLVPAVGRSGRVIGVDLTDAMLDQARARISAHRWTNVDLVNSDAGSYEFRGRVDGVFSSFALTLVPDFEDVIARAAAALAPGRALVALDLKRPDGIPEWLVRVGVFVSRPFGVTLDLADRHP